MSRLPPSPCRAFGCPKTTHEGFCETHKRERQQKRDRSRGTATERGYDILWRRLRLQALQRDEWRCRLCGWEPDLVKLFREADVGMPTESIILEELRRRHNASDVHFHVDHIETIEKRPDLRLTLDNLQTLCSPCHNRKTMNETFHNES